MTDLNGLTDREYTAVVDSIEDGLATVFFEQNGEEVGHAILEATKLPDDGQHADAILTVAVEDGEIATADYDPDTTATRNTEAQSRFDSLSSRPPSDEDS